MLLSFFMLLVVAILSATLISGDVQKDILDNSSRQQAVVSFEIGSRDPDLIDAPTIFSDTFSEKYEGIEVIGELGEIGGIDYSCLHANSWILNANNQDDKSSIFSTATEVISSTASGNSWTITTNQIPYYNFNFTADVIASLNSRPKRSTDFSNGYTTAEVNTVYPFGSDIGYASKACSMGYWPPGPVCPIAKSKSISFPTKPAQEMSTGKFKKKKNKKIKFHEFRYNIHFSCRWMCCNQGGSYWLVFERSGLLRLERHGLLQRQGHLAEYRTKFRAVRP